MKKHLILALAATMAMLFTACKKDDPSSNGNNDNGPKGFVVNEGLWGGNNASLDAINLENGNVTSNFFSSNNGRGLGDVAQDAIIYGSKLYVTVSESKTLEVINPTTGKSIKQISFPGNPRYMVSHEGNIYVTCYNKSVIRIDTASLTISGTAPIDGMNPEGIALINNKLTSPKLYICSSWEYDNCGGILYDNKLIIVDPNSFTQVGQLAIGTNPQRIKALNDGRLVYCYTGNYSDIPGGLAILDPGSANITELNIACSGFDIYDGYIYAYSYDWATGKTAFYRINTQDYSKTPLTLNANFASVYGININPTNGDIYVTDSQNFNSNGDVYCFSADGSQKWSASVGIGPSKVAF